ncbi:hypothetical protein [Oceaniglobus trochenteri]|uniref:hypothetical protein n=1 Tax=Oceaniglobus trochenteri TaxID=2763260 RepID=UPI001CFF802F|nr:hypothetical protein [Oceaniglobus trochenteri]
MLRSTINDDFMNDLPLRLFRPNELRIELGFVIAACGCLPASVEATTDDEWRVFMTDRFPREAPKTENAWHQSLSSTERERIVFQALRVGRVLDNLEGYAGPGHEAPQWCLLPQDWYQRMSVVLGSCSVPFAWIAIADGLQ